MMDKARVVCEASSFKISNAITPEFLNFEMTVSEDIIFVNFETNLAQSASKFSGGNLKSFSLTHKDLKHLPHELVAQCLKITQTDEKLTKIKVLRDASDRLTPDSIIVRHDDSIEVLEIKTSRTYHGVDKVFESTKNKYMNALEKRAEEVDIHFCIVVVCPTGVCTNLNLHQEEVDVLVAHYLLGCYFQDQAKSQGWNPEKIFEEENEFLKYLSTVKLDLRKLNCRGEFEPLHINESMVIRWNSIPALNPAKIFDVNLNRNKKAWETLFENQSKDNFVEKRFDDQVIEFVRKVPTSSVIGEASPVFHLPLIAMDNFSIISPSWRIYEIGSFEISTNSTYGKLWSDAMFECSGAKEAFEESMGVEAERQIKEKGYWEADKSTVSKSKRYVVKIGLTKPQRIELAHRGVQSKSLRRDAEIIENREESKKTYSLDSDTQDIHDSFSPQTLSHWISHLSKNLHPSEIKIKDLLAKAKSIAGEEIDPPCETFLKTFMGSRIGLALTFLNEIVSEVNFSRLKNVNKDHFVLKRLPNYKAYLLLKPTTSDKHIFFSLLIPKENMGDHLSLGEGMIDLGGCYCTPFSSLDRHKISHYLYCHLKMALMLSFWCHQFSIVDVNKYEGLTVEVMSHFWMTLLVYLEDKEKTSTALQLIRYAYMEVIKGGLIKPNPGKIFKKLDPLIRSRLLVFCIKNFIPAFKYMAKNPPSVVLPRDYDPNSSEDCLDRLISWVDGSILPNFEVALNLSYLGVLHNKEEGNLIHGYLKIFDKVIDQELKLGEVGNILKRERMTVSREVNANSLGDHEFSAFAIKSFARVAKNVIKAKHGDYDTWIQGAVTNSLLRRTFEELATSKASASEEIDEAPEISEEEKEFHALISDWRCGKLKDKPKPSLKCVENIYDLLTSLDCNDNKVFKHFINFLSTVESTGGIKVKLFKKLQIGGTREIFILPMRARIIINFLETICRTLCEELPCEMLTKGDQKISRSDSHYRRLYNMKNAQNSITVINSDDAATWAQRFVMPAFGVMLNELLPHPFKNPCLRVLNLVTSKLLVLPSELLRLFSSYKTVSSFNMNMERLKTEYLRTDYSGPRRLVELNSNLMKNRSNMMQGILHYTSSLLHSCYMTSLVMFIEERLNGPIKGVAYECVATGKVSSDDSSLLISIASIDDKGSERMKIMSKACTILSLLKGVCYPLICARQSEEKSTVGCMNSIEEFNSLWYFRNTLLTPSIKFVAASVRTHVTDRFELRQHVMSGLRSQVFENSGSIELTSLVQYCQLRAHYQSLGSSSNVLFAFYSDLIERVPHPSLGFFLLEPSLAAGILGYKFSYFLLLKKSVPASKVAKFFQNTSLMAQNTTMTSGTVLSLTQGSRARYDNMLKRMKVSFDDVLTYFDNNPEALYERPENLEQIKMMIALKASNPTMSNSFEFLTDSKQHAASSYVLQCPCVTVRERTLTFDPRTRNLEAETKVEKLSLAGFCYKVCVEVHNKPALSEADMKLLFPNEKLFLSTMDFVIKANDMARIISAREKKSYIIVNVPKYGVTFLADPPDCVKSKWFGRQTRQTAYEIDQTWNTLSRLFPWLKESYTQTLLESPLGSSVAVAQFFHSLPTSLSSVRILTAAYKKSAVFDTIKELIQRAQWPKIVLRGVEESPSKLYTPYSSDGPPEIGPPEEEGQFEVVATPSTSSGWNSRLRLKKQGAVAEDATRKVYAQSLATALWFEASLPKVTHNKRTYGYCHNDSRIKRILEQMKPVVMKSSLTSINAFAQLTPQESTLAIFQSVVKDGCSDISTCLKCTKRGLIGSFVQRATFDPALKRYLGPAIFRGKYNGVNFELHSHNESCTKLVLASREDLARLIPGFMRIVSDLRCDLMAPEHAVRMASREMRPEFVCLRRAEIKRSWHSSLIIFEENAFMNRVRISKIKPSFVVGDDGILRIVDNYSDEKVKEDRQRKHTILHYYPAKPRDIDTSQICFVPFTFRKPLKFGITKNPYDLFVLGKPIALEGLTNIVNSALCKEPDSLGWVFPELVEWLRETLKARAETSLGMLQLPVALSHCVANFSGGVTENPLDIEEVLVTTEAFQELFDVGDASFNLSDFDEIISDSDIEDEVSSKGKDLRPLSPMPTLWADYCTDPEADFITQFKEFRPMADFESKVDARKHSPFWDKLLDRVKTNSNAETRARAFSGKCKRGCSEDIHLIAKLFNEDGMVYLPEDEGDEVLVV